MEMPSHLRTLLPVMELCVELTPVLNPLMLGFVLGLRGIASTGSTFRFDTSGPSSGW